MSDQELGKKMVEEEELLPFLDAYKEVVGENLSYGFGRNESNKMDGGRAKLTS
jgi:hypothetical protein